jgi:ribosome-associated translation inhibitor RaiA
MMKTPTEVQNRLFSGSNKEVPNWFRKYVNEKLAHLYRAEKKIIEPVPIKYDEIFHDYEDNDFKSNNVVVHKIETGFAAPIKKAPYKTPLL